MPCLTAVETGPALLLVVTWLALLCGAFMVFRFLNCVLGAWEPVTWDWVLYYIGA